MKIRENKGMISIILIMAIFVLLSISTVTVSNVNSNTEDIIERAEEAKKETENQQLIEIIELKISEKQIELFNNEQRTITEEEIIDILDNYGTLIDDNQTLIIDDGSEIDTTYFFDI